MCCFHVAVYSGTAIVTSAVVFTATVITFRSAIEAVVSVAVEGCAARAAVITFYAATVHVVVVVAEAEMVVFAVVEEVASIPISAIKTCAEVAKAVINASVVAYVPSPIARVPEVFIFATIPVTRCPECFDIRRIDPCAVNPVIAFVAVGPVAGCPDVSIAWGVGLFVHWDHRRSDTDRDEHMRICCRRSHKHGARKCHPNDRAL